MSDSITFGHKYLDISFIIAQSAFLCSLSDTVRSVRSGSWPAGLAGLLFCTLSIFTVPSCVNGFCVAAWASSFRGSSLRRREVEVNGRYGSRKRIMLALVVRSGGLNLEVHREAR